MNPLRLDILLVDDDPDDVELTREMLSRTRISGGLITADNGERALALLRAAARLPDLILLDLNMPIMDGRQLLKALKADPVLKVIPVLILSTSNAAEDAMAAHRLGAGGYVAKPMGLEQLSRAAAAIEDFSAGIVPQGA